MSWVVERVNDDGRRKLVRVGLRAETAMELAGRLRDRQSDADVGRGWNVLARAQHKPKQALKDSVRHSQAGNGSPRPDRRRGSA